MSTTLRRTDTPAESLAVIGTSMSLNHMQGWLKAMGLAERMVSSIHVRDLSSSWIERMREHPRIRVLVSLPVAMIDHVHIVGRQLKQADMAWSFMPTAGDLLTGKAFGREDGWGQLGSGAEGMRLAASGSIDPAVLIDRPQRPVNESLLRSYLWDQVVLVTGAGGSIGSQLCRIIARQNPARLVLMERSENALFEIQRELRRDFPKLAIHAQLHDVTHRTMTMKRFEELRPDVVLHAAAHKHVPMMEQHPAEAVMNNLYGTRWVVDAAKAAGVSRLVMISTDKAVNPSSVMGATKRLAELYVQHVNARSEMVGCMVRFGNVLGSASSVLPIWSRQVAEGGPITVTHPQMTRYVMTIPEAAGLVLASGGLAEGGEVFVLEMGEPVRVLDLAERFCRSQGLEPSVDIDVVFTGARPGEKLSEELAYGDEDVMPTRHAGIRCWRRHGLDDWDVVQMLRDFDALLDSGGENGWGGVTAERVVAMLQRHLPQTYRRAA